MYVESVHYSLDGHEKKRGLKVKKNIGSEEHLKRALKSHISFNLLRVGSPDRVMTIRKNSPKLGKPSIKKNGESWDFVPTCKTSLPP